jgi:hypothetical protein
VKGGDGLKQDDGSQAGMSDVIHSIPKIPIWVYFREPRKEKFWYILEPSITFHGHLVHFEVTWYIFPVLVRYLYQEISGSPDGKTLSHNI